MNKKTFLAIENNQRRAIIIRPEYAEMLGDLHAAAILSDIVYYHAPDHRGGNPNKLKTKKKGLLWYVRSAESFAGWLKCTEYKAKAAIKIIKKSGYVIVGRYQNDRGAPVNHYRINWDSSLIDDYEKCLFGTNALVEIRPMEKSESDQSLNSNLKGNNKKELKDSNQPMEGDSDHQLMSKAIGRVCGFNLNVKGNWGRVVKPAKELADAGYTPAQIESIYGPGGWWFSNDWRAKKNTPPNPAQIIETIGRVAMTAKPGEAPDVDDLREQMKKANEVNV